MKSTNIIFFQYYKSTIGDLILGSCKDELCLLDFRYRKMRSAVDKRILSGLNAEFIDKDTPFLKSVRLQIDAFLKGEKTSFTLPIKMVGSPFQLRVWKALQTIPYGKTISYLELAHQIGDKNAVQAVANALALIVPCHRVIGSSNQLVGYAGGLYSKKKLLQLELSQSHNPNELPFWESETG
ncbi:methylated-DNA--[protein]-cysteine S-methyltransferase [Flavobacteriaceae bacterium]|nr:methylated-DNA--[protein]-cysteine S-methyltransferase [Flavobacteriaceae bacterium]